MEAHALGRKSKRIKTILFCLHLFFGCWTASAQSFYGFSTSSMNLLPDGTISWHQPDPEEIISYNGRCGETAAANILSMLSRPRSPDWVVQRMYDLTPGTLPQTLEYFLNDVAPGIWQYGATDEQLAIETLRHLLNLGTFKAANGKSPVAVLIQEGASALHWVTVVDVRQEEHGLEIVYNENAKQRRASAKRFLHKWGFRETWDPTVAVAVSACCQPFTAIYQLR